MKRWTNVRREGKEVRWPEGESGRQSQEHKEGWEKTIQNNITQRRHCFSVVCDTRKLNADSTVSTALSESSVAAARLHHSAGGATHQCQSLRFLFHSEQKPVSQQSTQPGAGKQESSPNKRRYVGCRFCTARLFCTGLSENSVVRGGEGGLQELHECAGGARKCRANPFNDRWGPTLIKGAGGIWYKTDFSSGFTLGFSSMENKGNIGTRFS